MPKKFKIETVRINRIGDFEYDIIAPQSGLDAHIRYEGKTGWVMDVFEGTKQTYSCQVGRCKDHGPDWNEAIEWLAFQPSQYVKH